MIKMIKIEAITVPEWYIDSKTTKNRFHRACNIINRYGQFKPILVNMKGEETFELVAGRLTWEASKNIGLKEVYCFIFVNISQSDAITLNLIDNSSRELDVIKSAKKIDLAKDLKPSSLANILNHTKEELMNLKSLKDFNWEDFDNEESHFIQHSLF